MLKKLLAALLALCAAAAFAAVDVNKADQAALESVKGIGPAISGKILEERKKGSFKDWNDLIERVKGVGEGNAAKFSADGLTVNGASFGGAAPAKKDAGMKAAAPKAKDEAKAEKAAAKETKAEAKADTKADAAKPAASAAEAKQSAAEKKAEKKAEKDAKKAEAKSEKATAKDAPAKPAAASAPASAAKK
jgi:competence protein ComEA